MTMIIVVHGNSQKYKEFKGLDLLVKDLKELGFHVHEYIWNGNLEQAAFNIKQETDDHKKQPTGGMNIHYIIECYHNNHNKRKICGHR